MSNYADFTFNPNEYEEKGSFEILPEGNYRVRVAEVIEKVFKSGKEGFELTLDVSGKNSKLWYYIVLDPDNRKITNQKLGDFFKSFGITDYDLNHFNGWVGKVGGAKVKHEQYNGNVSAKVHYFLNKEAQNKLPAWSEPSGSQPKNDGFTPIQTSDVPW
jgi:hypothetical protein